MTPKPITKGGRDPNLNKVVISGMSGAYPQCNNVKEFSDLLYNKVDPITTDTKRWNYEHPEVAKYTGDVPNLDLFDAQFFRVHRKLATQMDAMSRKILEHTYQAIYDAGLSPEHLSGKNVGVYIGVCFSESEKVSFYVPGTRTGLGIAGASKAMFANRISFWLNTRGPSMTVDEACCSSIAALKQAYHAISKGYCESAIVGGANLSIHPHSTVHFSRIMQTSKDGKLKSFDENADGIVKTEAVTILFLQNEKDALRAYADVLHVKSEYLRLEGETDPKYGFYRDPEIASNFLSTFYEEAGIFPKDVEYVEAFGSAIPEADKAELEAINEVYCKDREDQLLVGSVMSNIGYAEAATGMSSIVKIILAYHRGKLAANLNCLNPRKDIPALRDGRISIVTEHEPFQRTLTAVNSISFTGCNAHALLHGRYRHKDPSRYKSSIPRLVTLSGRHERAVKKIIEELKSRPIDPEELALFHNIHSLNISGHLGRGFAILDTDANENTLSLVEKCEYIDAAKKPLWFVYSGMGSQWAGMGTQLMRIPIFASAIQRCQLVLKPKGLDLLHIITSTDKTTFDNILNSFVGIAAIQIGLTDMLKELGLVPDKIIGHSVGELGCAYADGCFTAEEMILAAYSRGLVSLQTPFIHGSMAAVGMGYQQMTKLLPPNIEVACHNSSESCTISGPSDAMKEFVAKLTSMGIFAREVPCSNIAYHSRYIANAGPGLLKYLTEVIKNPKPRSNKWVSTSVPESKWGEQIAKYSSPEYHTNNLLSPVLFEEVTRLIPPNAVLVEIAPHGLLQAILKRSLPSCRHIPLTRRGHPKNDLYLLEAVGNLYMEGYTPKVSVLYPKVQFPVSTETPILSHMVEWTHNEKWGLPLYLAARKKVAASSKFAISVHDEEHRYLRGNVIRGKTTYPFAASLVAVWDTLAMWIGVDKKKISVEFRDVHLFSQPTLQDQRLLRLTVALHRGSGRFEIMNDQFKVASGFVLAKTHPLLKIKHATGENQELALSSEDIYQIFSRREYSYSGEFKSINCANMSLTEALLTWEGNWVTLIDGMLQLYALKQNHNGVSEPTYIKSLSVNIKEHFYSQVVNVNGKSSIKASLLELYDHIWCGGIFIENVKFQDVPTSVAENKIILKSLQFVPRFQCNLNDENTTLQVYCQIVAENVSKNIIEIVEVTKNTERSLDKQVFQDIPGLKVHFKQYLVQKENQKNQDHVSNADLVIVHNLSLDDTIFQLLYNTLNSNTFVACIEKDSHSSPKNRPSTIFRIISSHSIGKNSLHLARWRPSPTPPFTTSFTVRSTKDLPLLSSTKDSLPSDYKLLVLTSYPPVEGVKEIIANWRKESSCNHASLIMINHKTEDNNMNEPSDFDLAFNILDEGSWGGEYYVPLSEKQLSVGNMCLQSEVLGDINSLRWVEVPEPLTPGILVKVHYAGLNNLDVKKATGIYPISCDLCQEGDSYGMDFSGVTQNGARVMGIVKSGAASSSVRVLPELIWPVPSHWTLEEAATVPLPYAHAFYCLVIKSKLLPNRSILVHGGAGALGQAVISIALAHGLSVFTTVSDTRKKHFLRKLFPELQGDHIGNSRDNSFGDMVMTLTKGVGVDYVINCVKGELKNTSLTACAPFAVILETQTKDNFHFGMYHLTNDKNYVNVNFSSIFTERKFDDMRKLQWLLSEGISRGYVRPLSRVSYPPESAARAFHLLEGSRHRGRVLLKIIDSVVPVHPRVICSSSKCSIILADHEILATRLADMLITRGAKKLHLHLPRASPSMAINKQRWESLSVEVKLSTEDITGVKGITAFLNESVSMGPVESVYLMDTLANKPETLQATLTALDIMSRKLCPTIKHFAVISTDKSFGNQTIISRINDKIPAFKLIIAPTFNSKSSEHNIQNVLDGLERVLRSNVPICCVVEKREINQTLMEKIAKLTGVTLPTTIEDTTTLKDMGVSQENIDSIAFLLRNEYNTVTSEDDILSLNVEQIRDIEQNTYGVEYEEAKGLEAIFTQVDSDELKATTEMVFMPTLTCNSTARDDEFNVSEPYLCIVPGLEGHHERFRELCERIKVPAVVLQPGLDHPDEGIQQTAIRYAQNLLKRASLQNNFYLLGYETGVMVALEMAAILEEQGLTGTIFCIGAPEQLKSILQEELQNFKSIDALQEAVIRHMFHLMGGADVEYSEFVTWREKVESCVRTLKRHVPLSTQYVRAQFEVTLSRLLSSTQYTPLLKPLQSKLVFIRPSNLRIGLETLQKYSTQPIVMHDLRAPLSLAMKDLRCAAIVNQHLHPDILNAFHKKNLCDTYFLNAETFMTLEVDESGEENERKSS